MAAAMEPPAALDAVVAPLRQSPPAPARRVRPLYRWLGAAAAIVLGVTVAMEVVQRNPGPTTDPARPERHRPIEAEEKIFELAPLPTAEPDENRPLGAVDRLLDEEPSPPHTPEMAPLEVIGPISTDVETDPPPPAEEAVRVDDLAEAVTEPPARTTTRDVDAAQLAGRESSEGSAAAELEKKADGGKRAGAASVTGKMMAEERPAPKTISRRKAPSSVHLTVGDIEVWSGADASCPVGSWPVRVEIRGGVVASLETIGDELSDTTSARCRPDSLLGSAVLTIDDGWYEALLVVADPAP
jgi:hypothetical protein